MNRKPSSCFVLYSCKKMQCCVQPEDLKNYYACIHLGFLVLTREETQNKTRFNLSEIIKTLKSNSNQLKVEFLVFSEFDCFPADISLPGNNISAWRVDFSSCLYIKAWSANLGWDMICSQMFPKLGHSMLLNHIRVSNASEELLDLGIS